ncbi:MAG: HU family DNA-binding protein [Nitrospirae bacterium]|nr:HU family DNA-binding protein [Nitrospirota bacterium]
MTKHELIEKIAGMAGISKVAAGDALNAAIEGITSALKKGQKVSLTGFGSFSVMKRKPRIGRNPKTGDSIKIPACRVPKFSAGKELKAAVK